MLQKPEHSTVDHSLSPRGAIPGNCLRKEEERTLPGAYNDNSGTVYVTTVPEAGLGTLTQFPFGARGSDGIAHLQLLAFASPLGPAHPRPNAVRVEPFPSSALKVST